jgi:membrane protein YqaA with SNARE-associated domain
VLAALLSTLAVGFGSALLPAIPVEPYLVGLVVTTGSAPVLLGLAAAVGQTAGKLLIFLSVRGAVRSAWLRRLLARRADRPPSALGSAGARLAAALDRPLLALPVVLLSAVVGFPPLLLTSAYAGRTRMPASWFALTCLLGRSVRFVAIALAPQLLGH